MKRDPLVRRGLAESLEEFAARIGSTPDRARICWRLQGLRYLHPAKLGRYPWEAMLTLLGPNSSCRIAPGVPVPTRPQPQTPEY